MSKRCSPDVLRQYADIFPPFDGLTESSKGREWSIGSLGVWKSGTGEPVFFHGRRVPTYRRGSLVFDLRDEMRFVLVPFTLTNGADATALVLRSDDEELIGCWTLDTREAERVAAFLNAELETLRVALAHNAAQPHHPCPPRS